jgi:hypothetical protein
MEHEAYRFMQLYAKLVHLNKKRRIQVIFLTVSSEALVNIFASFEKIRIRK